MAGGYATSYPVAISADWLGRMAHAGYEQEQERRDRRLDAVSDAIRSAGSSLASGLETRLEHKREDRLREEARQYAEKQKKYWYNKEQRDTAAASYDDIYGQALAAGGIIGESGRIAGGPVEKPGYEEPNALLQSYGQTLEALAPYAANAKTPEEAAALQQVIGQVGGMQQVQQGILDERQGLLRGYQESLNALAPLYDQAREPEQQAALGDVLRDVRSGYENIRPFDIVMPSETPSADLYDIQQSEGYLRQKLAEKALAEEYQQELDKIAARPQAERPVQPPSLATDQQNQILTSAALLRDGMEFLDIARDLGPGGIGKIDVALGKLERFFTGEGDDFFKYATQADVDNAIKDAKLNLKQQQFVHKMVKMMQGSRPSDFDVKVYRDLYDTITRSRSPQLVISVMTDALNGVAENASMISRLAGHTKQAFFQREWEPIAAKWESYAKAQNSTTEAGKGGKGGKGKNKNKPVDEEGNPDEAEPDNDEDDPLNDEAFK